MAGTMISGTGGEKEDDHRLNRYDYLYKKNNWRLGSLASRRLN
jgi:hypothetical protein